MYTLVTGASSGIGKSLAVECAKRGMDLLLVALPGEELFDLEKLLRAEYRIRCHAFAADLSQNCASEKVYEWVKENNFPVNVLINNVGVGSKGRFETVSPDFYLMQINLNIVTTCLLTRLLISVLKQNTPAHILNLGSMGGFFIIPDKAVYSASKAFIFSFSRSLRLELKASGITVSVLCPGGTDSNHKTVAINGDLKGLAKRSVLTAEEVAKEAVPRMLKGDAVIIPGFLNKCSYALSHIIPKSIQNFMVARAFKSVGRHKY